MTLDGPVATYVRNGESREQVLERLGTVVAEARERAVICELSAVDLGPEVLSAGLKVFGTRAAACAWLSLPALSLNGRRPLALLRTREGAQALIDLLGRLECGVYS